MAFKILALLPFYLQRRRSEGRHRGRLCLKHQKSRVRYLSIIKLLRKALISPLDGKFPLDEDESRLDHARVIGPGFAPHMAATTSLDILIGEFDDYMAWPSKKNGASIGFNFLCQRDRGRNGWCTVTQ